MLSSALRHLAFTVVLTAAIASRSTAQTGVDADAKEMQEYRLTPATLTKLGQVQENLYAALKAHPELGKRYAGTQEDSEDEPKTLDDMAKRFDRIPEVKQAIVKSGLTPRQYLLATMAMLQAGIGGAAMEMPGADKSKITPAVQANIAFMKVHKTEIDRMQARAKEIEKLTKTGEDEPPPQ